MTEKQQTTKSKIQLAALQLFLEYGYKDMSYDMLIKKSGLSKGAIYHHFESKNALLISVFEIFQKQSVERSKHILAYELEDFNALKNLMMKLLSEQMKALNEMLGGKPFKMNRWLFFVEAINENTKLTTIMDDMYKQELKLLEACFKKIKNKEGRLKEKSAATWAEILLLMSQGAEMRLLFSQTDLTEKDFVKLYKKVFSQFEQLFRN